MIILAVSVLYLSGCRKDMTSTDNSNPSKFTELKVDPSFTFDNYVILNMNLSVNSSVSSSMNIIQVYEDDPGHGKLIVSGVTYGSQSYTNNIRVPKAAKNLYLTYNSSDGKHESAIVSIDGSSLFYVFGGTKSGESLENS